MNLKLTRALNTILLFETDTEQACLTVNALTEDKATMTIQINAGDREISLGHGEAIQFY